MHESLCYFLQVQKWDCFLYEKQDTFSRLLFCATIRKTSIKVIGLVPPSIKWNVMETSVIFLSLVIVVCV
jgi:hypothetical protein